MSLTRLNIGKTAVLFDDKQPVREKSGKFSLVFTGVLELSGTKVLVKKLRGYHSTEEEGLSKYVRIGKVRHPALQKIYGITYQDGDVYLVSRFVEGTDLKQWLREKGRLRNVAEIKSVALDLLEGLSAFHSHGIIHTDIKPANIILQEGREGLLHAVLIDPGEAVQKDIPPAERKPFALIYGAPEQVLGFNDLINETSDLYSLGVVLWEMFTGETPFYTSHPAAIINLQLTHPLKKDRRIPDDWHGVIAKATSKTIFPKPPGWYSRAELHRILINGQRQRYPSAAAMAEAVKTL